MATFHLRPVEKSPSHSPTSSNTPPGDDHSPRYKAGHHRHTPPLAPALNGRSRRPLSPSSIRDVDLTHAPDMQSRSRFPAPPTGHELMALFPPPPPESSPEVRPGPTSSFFQRQERAFFSQTGKEIIRVCIDVDFPNGTEPAESLKSKSLAAAARNWPNPLPHPSPGQASSASSSSSSNVPVPLQLYPHPNTRPAPSRGGGGGGGGGGNVPVPHLYPLGSHPPAAAASQHPHNLHHQPSPSLRTTPPQDLSQTGPPVTKAEYPPREDYDDESWRRPMPYSDRRRAGKHTKRVIVRT